MVKNKKKYLFYISLSVIIALFMFSNVTSLPFISTTLNTGIVSNQTAMSIVFSWLTFNFNVTSISTNVSNLSSESTLITQRNNIGISFDDAGSAVLAQNSYITYDLTGNFTILIKALINTSGDTFGTLWEVGNGSTNMYDYQIGVQSTNKAVTFAIANGSANNIMTAANMFTDNQINYIMCGINQTDKRWCANGGSYNISSTSLARTLDHFHLGNNTIIGTALSTGANSSGDFYGNIYNIAIVNKSLEGNQLDSFRWNDGRIVPTAITTESKANKVVQLFDNGTIIAYGSGNISVSTDGITYTYVTTLQADINGSVSLWRDGYNNTYLSNWANGKLYRAASNSLIDWVNVLNVTCDNSTGARINTPNGFTRAPNGYLFVGSYVVQSDGNDEQCGHVWRSTDNGLTWSIIYNDTAVQNLSSRVARHVHFVQVDPYTNKTYVSLGDTTFRRKTIVSSDYGETWTVLGSEIERGISWQPYTIMFTPNYRIIGMDTEYSAIYRSSDDLNWDPVFNIDDQYYGFWTWGVKDSNGRIYMGMGTVLNSTPMIIVESDDEFNTTQIVWQKNAGTFPDNAGTVTPTIVDSNNSFYISFSGFSKNNTKIQYQPKPQVLDQWTMNEGQGNKTVSAQGYTGNFLANATWTNASGYKTLLNNVDYRIVTDSTFGNITILNEWFNHSLIDVILASYSPDSMYNYLNFYASFDADNGTNSFDYSLRQHNMTYVGNLPNNETNCIYGKCIHGTGNTSQYIVVDQTAGDLTGNTTILFWYRLADLHSVNTFFSKWNTTGRNLEYYVGTTTTPDNTAFKLSYSTDGSSQNSSNAQWAGVFTPYEWTHIALVQINNSYTLYRNGEDFGNKTLTISSAGNTTLIIGRESTNSALNGSLDELMFFNVSLTPEQISNIYFNNTKRFLQNATRNVTYIINESNKLNVSLNILATESPLNSVLLTVVSSGNGTGPTTNSSFIYIANTNYTFSLATNSTNISLNYTLDSGNGFLTPVIGLTEDIFGFIEQASSGGTSGATLLACDSLVLGFATFPILIGLVGTIMFIGFVVLLLFGFVNIKGGVEFSPEMIVIGLLTLIGIAVVVVIALIIFTNGALCF